MRATARQISFADWELMRQRDQGIRLEPLLEAISGFLDDQRDMIERIQRDLVRGLKPWRGIRNSGMRAIAWPIRRASSDDSLLTPKL